MATQQQSVVAEVVGVAIEGVSEWLRECECVGASIGQTIRKQILDLCAHRCAQAKHLFPYPLVPMRFAECCLGSLQKTEGDREKEREGERQSGR